MAKDSDAFWRRQKPAAVLKHAVLSQYVVPFASKAGKSAKDKRVVFVDGYAGRGRYDDGTPGSPLLFAKAAREMDYRNIECHFVESKKDTYDRLVEVMTAEAEGLNWTPHYGSVDDHLDALLQAAEGVPLFLFLDPFGFSISFDAMVGRVYGRPKYRYAPATEVLLNFSANAVRRTAALVDSAKENPNRDAQLKRLTSFCGGDWWQDLWSKKVDNEQFNERMAHEYLIRVRKATGCLGVVMPVHNRERKPATYHLVFLTRREEGLYEFTEAASRAGERWREAIFYAEDFGDLSFDPAVAFAAEEEVRRQEWYDTLRRNVLGLLAREGPFVVQDRYSAVFNDVLGVARRSPHLRDVLKQLHAEGVTSSDSTGDLLKKRVVRSW